MAKKEEAPAGVASEKDNAKLEHVEGGTTTRDDATDVGVPMLQGSPDEPVGPEDALGRGPKRGDYSDRVPGRPTQVERDSDGNVRVVDQRPRASERGDESGRKGGVETA